MASFLVTNLTSISFSVYVQGLQTPANKYDSFTFKIYQNNTLIYNWSSFVNSTWLTFLINFKDDEYLGYNYVTPATDYELEVIARQGGVNYSLGRNAFTTDSISQPIGTISPSIYTKIKSQGRAGSCVAMSLSTAMDIFKAKQIGVTYESYSVSYIYGNGGLPNEQGMYFKDAIVNCCTLGSPRWELVESNFNSKLIEESKYIYNNSDSYAKNNAVLQAFDGYRNVDFYDTEGVASAIRNYGYFMFNFKIPNNFYSIGSDGIVPQPNSYSGVSHSIALIGLTTKNGKAHWIAHNSWGTDWGANGLCYIPYDWGCGVLAPTRGGSNPTSWSQNCYSVWNTNISSSHPSTPSNLTAVKSGDKSALISWSSVSGATYTVFASKASDENWYIKGRTTSTSLTITFDNYDKYKIRVLSSVNNLYSNYSNVVIVSLLAIEPWVWQIPKTSGIGFNVSAGEWLNFCNRINEIRAINGLSNYSFTTDSTYISKGKDFYAWIFLQACTAINQIKGQVASACLNVKSNDDIYAWYFDNLKTALNNSI